MINSFSINEYKFEGVAHYPKAVVVVNLILFSILFILGVEYILQNPYTWFSLLSGIGVFLFCLLYNWRTPYKNALITLLYASLVIIEFVIFGFPDSPVQISSRTISKGIMLDLGVGILPYIYFGLRAGGIVCFLPVWWYSRMLD